MFIHWGLYAIPGRGEWVQWNEQIPVEEYARLADQFNPTNFNADAWAEITRAAGMKYMVLTTRHHDGFCLFDSKASEFKARRDYVADFVKAARSAGLRVGFYYSPLDWRFPGFFFPDLYRQSAEAMREQYHRQMKELLSNYGTLDVIWFDGGEADWLNFGGEWRGAQWQKRPQNQHYRGGFDWQHDQVYAMLRQLQPQAVINGRADMPEDFHSREGDGALGNFDNEHPWELCTTIVSGPWGWKPEAPVKSLRQLLHLLVGAAGRDGNFLLNVGPRPDGQIDPPQAQRLREIGAWLTRHGQSIYGTRGGPFLPGDYGVSTRRRQFIYLHVLNWSGDALHLPPIKPKVLRATGATFTQTERGIDISVPPAQRDELDTVVVLELDQPADNIPPVEVK
jgi:alpha-L-fucosidase